MRTVRISSEAWPGVRASHARSFRERLMGLTAPDSMDALLIETRSVHTFGLERSIQLVALDREMIVLESRRIVPGRVAYFGRASSILELDEHVSVPPEGTLLEVTDV